MYKNEHQHPKPWVCQSHSPERIKQLKLYLIILLTLGMSVFGPPQPHYCTPKHYHLPKWFVERCGPVVNPAKPVPPPYQTGLPLNRRAPGLGVSRSFRSIVTRFSSFWLWLHDLLWHLSSCSTWNYTRFALRASLGLTDVSVIPHCHARVRDSGNFKNMLAVF